MTSNCCALFSQAIWRWSATQATTSQPVACTVEMPSRRFMAKLLADRGGADPHLGELLVVGNRIAVEIDAHHAEFIDEVADFFTIENGKIQRLAVYSGPRRPK